MPEIIASAEQVTPEWLTGTLRAKGYLGQSRAMSVLEVSRTRHTATWFADISFLKVSYSGKAPRSAPSRLFLKISRDDLESADLLYGRQEVEFYNTIANAMDDPPLPCCYDAVYAPDTGRSHILLQDLSETHSQPQPPLPPSRSECELTMDCLARFHAHWWEHPRLAADIGKLSHQETPSAEDLGFARPLAETAEMFPGFADFLGDRLSAAQRALYERVFSSWPFTRLSQRVDERRHVTLIHRDAHAWNFLYPRDPARDRVCIIDWHEWGIGLGANDLTEMIALWWYPERRARMEEPLVRRYHRQLTEHGVEGYEWEQCWNDYRLSASRILLYPIWMHGEGRPPTYWWPVLERGISAFEDLECVEILE